MLKILIIFLIFCSLQIQIKADNEHYHCTDEPWKCILKDFGSVEELDEFCNGMDDFLEYSDRDGQKKYYRRYSDFYNIEFQNVSITRLPIKCLEKFFSINTLIVSNCGIEEIKMDNFQNSKKIEILDLSGNKIQKLDNSLFKYLDNIYEIDLSYNLIEVIEPTLFVESLRKINLNHNQIKVFDEDLLQSFFEKLYDYRSAEVLIKLDNNKIEKFIAATKNCQANLWSNGPIITLNLSSNALKLIESKCEMNELDLSNNQLNEVKVDAQILDISNNPLDFSQIDSLAYIENTNKLLMSNTGLDEIQYGLFDPLRKLEYLDICNNLLTTIDYHKFVAFDNLQILNISGNQLQSIEDYQNIKKALPHLQKIGLEGNNWDCYNLAQMKISLNVNGIEILEALNPVKIETNVVGIKCRDK